MPEPPVCSIVSVYETTLPQRSEATRWVVDCPCSVAGARSRGGAAAGGQIALRGGGVQRLPPGDLTGPAVGEALGQQGGGRHLDVRRVAHVGGPVGEGQRRGVQVVVQGPGVRHPAQVHRVEDVQGLAHRRAARGGRSHPVHVEVPVAHPGRRPVDRAVRREVGGLQVAGPHGQRSVGCFRRLLDGPHDVVRYRPSVHDARTAPGDRLVGRGELGVAERRADCRCVAARKEQRGRRSDLGEPVFVQQRLAAERVVHHEPALGDPDRRLQVGRERLPSPPLQGALPGGGRARHPDRLAAGHQLRERIGLPVGRVGERGARHARRGGLPAVDGLHPARLRVVVDEVATAADARGVGLGHAERSRRGHRRVDRVATVPQHPEPGRGRLRIHTGDGTAPAVRGGVLLGDPMVGGRAGVGGRCRRARQQSAGQRETEQAGACPHGPSSHGELLGRESPFLSQRSAQVQTGRPRLNPEPS